MTSSDGTGRGRRELPNTEETNRLNKAAAAWIEALRQQANFARQELSKQPGHQNYTFISQVEPGHGGLRAEETGTGPVQDSSQPARRGTGSRTAAASSFKPPRGHGAMVYRVNLTEDGFVQLQNAMLVARNFYLQKADEGRDQGSSVSAKAWEAMAKLLYPVEDALSVAADEVDEAIAVEILARSD